MLTHDHPCTGCGYNLKGLFIGGNCPECGRVIGVPNRRAGGNLIDAPRGWLYGLVGGFTLLCLAIVGASVMAIKGEWIVQHTPIPRLLYMLGLVGCWIAGVVVLLRDRPLELKRKARVRDGPEHVALRICVLVGALAFGPAVFFDHTAISSSARWAEWLAITFGTIGGLGFIPLSFWLKIISEWAGDEPLTTWYRNIGLAMAIGVMGSALTACIAITGHPVLLLVASFAWAFWAIMLLSTLALLLSIVQMAWTCVWVLRNQTEARARAERMAQREAIEARERAEADMYLLPDPNIRSVDSAVPDLIEHSASEAPVAPMPMRFGEELVIKPSTEGPLKLEGE